LGFALDDRAGAVKYLNEETAQLEAAGARLLVEPRTFDLKLDAIAEIRLGVWVGTQEAPRLVSQLRAVMSPPASGEVLFFAGDAPPLSPVAGAMYYDTSEFVMRVWDGSSWATLM